MDEAKQYANNKAAYRNKKSGKVLMLKIPEWAVKQNEATGEYETEFELHKHGNIWIPTNKSIQNEYLQATGARNR